MARILVIDDDPDVRTLLAKFIEADGHEVLQAENAQAGDRALTQLPDAVLVDVSMPGETGAQFLLRMRQHPTFGRIPAMFVTAHSERAEPLKAAGLAGPRIIRKPFRREEIREALRAMLRSDRRRLDSRVRVVRDAVRCDLDGGGADVVKNLSLGGLYVVTRLRRAVGDRVELMLLYGDRTLRSAARVTHRGSDGLGLAYVDASADLVTAIDALIDDMLTDGESGDDRRRATRISVTAAIAFTDDKGRTEAQLKDLSASGAFVETANVPPLGSTIYLYLPGYTFSEGTRRRSELRGCVANVVRSSADGFGCQFQQPSAEFRMAADELMRSDGEQMLVGM